MAALRGMHMSHAHLTNIATISMNVPCVLCWTLLTHTPQLATLRSCRFVLCVRGQLIHLSDMQSDVTSSQPFSPPFLLPAPPAFDYRAFQISAGKLTFCEPSSFSWVECGYVAPLGFMLYLAFLQVVHWWHPPGLPACSGLIGMWLGILSPAADSFLRIDFWQINYRVKLFESLGPLGKWHLLILHPIGWEGAHLPTSW